jgi:hypothetical protein
MLACITDEASPFALRSTRNRPRTAVRRGAAWPAKRPSSCLSRRWSSPVRRSVIPLVALAAELSWLVDRPDASAQRSVQRSGTIAVLDNARTPAMASVAGPRPASGVTHPVPSPGARLSGPSGVRSARCPVTWVRRPGSGVRPSSVRPVRCPAVWGRPRPSGRVRLVPHQAVAFGDRPCGKATRTTGTGPGPVGCRVVERLGSTAEPAQTPATPPRSPMVGGLSVADPGRVGCGRRPRLTLASRARQAGVRSARRRRLRQGTGGGRSARLPHRPRGCRPRDGWATTVRGVVALAARVDGPGGADGLAGGDGRAAPARPGLAASIPGLLPTAL